MSPKRKKLDAGRPFRLGVDEVPPPLRVPWQMWSKSSNPHQQGLIQFEFTEEGLAVGWWPVIDNGKEIIPWDELAWMAGQQSPDLKKELEWIKEQAQTEGYKLAGKAMIERVDKIIADEPDNPFLLKYKAKLQQAIDEVKGMFR